VRAALGSLFPWVLTLTAVLLSAWLVVSRHTGGIQDPQHGKPDRFIGYFPRIPGWQARTVQVATSTIEPNILAYAFRPLPDGPVPPRRSEPVLARLVHGYNMVDCMRIKGYRVAPVAGTGPHATGQVWRMTSPNGRTAIWLTLMLDAGSLAATNVDTRSMAFPRVGTPDAPSWNPTGITLSGLRHPIRNTRLWLRSRWNSSRRDLLTFLRLRRAAWVSDRHFALVVEGWALAEDEPAREADIEALRHLLLQFRATLAAYAGPVTETGQSGAPAR